MDFHLCHCVGSMLRPFILKIQKSITCFAERHTWLILFISSRAQRLWMDSLSLLQRLWGLNVDYSCKNFALLFFIFFNARCLTVFIFSWWNSYTVKWLMFHATRSAWAKTHHGISHESKGIISPQHGAHVLPLLIQITFLLSLPPRFSLSNSV